MTKASRKGCQADARPVIISAQGSGLTLRQHYLQKNREQLVELELVNKIGRWELLECRDPRILDKILIGLFK